MKFKLYIALWLLLVGIGLHSLMSFSGKEGSLAVASTKWPLSSTLSRPQQKHLVMFIHPGCSCSKASLSELSRLMSRQVGLSAEVVFMKTEKLERLFEGNSLVKKAKLLPRTRLTFDPDGVEAKAFGAQTSGMSFLYDEKGTLLFSGGLTQSRGHEGRSAGTEAIERQLRGEASRKIAAVFGCDIFNNAKFLPWK